MHDLLLLLRCSSHSLCSRLCLLLSGLQGTQLQGSPIGYLDVHAGFVSKPYPDGG